MPALFNRKWKVTIGPVGGTGREWTGLRVLFRAWKAGDATPNKLELDIYNLSKDARHYIEGSGKDWAVRLEAGYESGINLIFTGRLELASSIKRGQRNHHHQGADWLTKVHGRDGVRAYRSVILSKSFGPKTSQEAVIMHIAKAMGVTVGKLKGLSKQQYNHGHQLCGLARHELDTLCRNAGSRWSIQDGVLNILPIGSAIDHNAIVVSASTGMIGSPERTERGVKVTMLLRGGINPGNLIQIDAQDLKGNYVVESVHHRGDSHDLEWYTEIECLRLS
jgi:hypothetical protein